MFTSIKKNIITLLSFNFIGKNLESFFAVISLEKVKICVCVQVLKNHNLSMCFNFIGRNQNFCMFTSIKKNNIYITSHSFNLYKLEEINAFLVEHVKQHVHRVSL